jgi:prolyl-tRNA synthetase
MSKGLPKRSEDYSQWYNELVKRADLAENSAVRGCMVIKPYGFSIWEKMQAELDRMFKKTGHSNAYFPLFIPKSFLSKEASHVEGFAKECAVVTHYRLKADPSGKGVIVDPEAALEEELIVRPTSETVIWSTYKNWIQSYRDLPLLINQWANVVRWEMRTRLFLRTSEFLWQEGHTAHATKKEAQEETLRMMNVYAEFAEKFMAMPVVKGVKTESEKFAGAESTYCIEAMMQDGKALQAGTSHFLGQNFAKAFDVKFATKEGGLEYVWGTSWGVSTRLMGALIMAHSDDRGLVLPPKLAPIQVVIVPIFKSEEELEEIRKKALEIVDQLYDIGISVKFDDRDTYKPGWKFNHWEVKGVPVRLEVGTKDIEKNEVRVVRRLDNNKYQLKLDGIADSLKQEMLDIQKSMYDKALKERDDRIKKCGDWETFLTELNQKNLCLTPWCDVQACEEKVKDKSKEESKAAENEGEDLLTGSAKTLCKPLDQPEIPEGTKCFACGESATVTALWGRSY